MDSQIKPKWESGLKHKMECTEGSGAVPALRRLPSKGQIPRPSAKVQKTANSCPKVQGCAAADIFGLDNPEGLPERKAKQGEALWGTRALGWG